MIIIITTIIKQIIKETRCLCFSFHLIGLSFGLFVHFSLCFSVLFHFCLSFYLYLSKYFFTIAHQIYIYIYMLHWKLHFFADFLNYILFCLVFCVRLKMIASICRSIGLARIISFFYEIINGWNSLVQIREMTKVSWFGFLFLYRMEYCMLIHIMYTHRNGLCLHVNLALASYHQKVTA